MEADALKKKAAVWLKKLGAYKYVFLVIAAGAILLLWPDGERGQTVQTRAPSEQSFSVEQTEEKLEEILSQIDGAGKVSVMLTVKGGTEQVLAQDTTVSDREETWETVVISTGSGTQEVVVQTQLYPEFRGALIVCEGGDDPGVKLLITQAVSSLTGLGSARITVCRSR